MRRLFLLFSGLWFVLFIPKGVLAQSQQEMLDALVYQEMQSNERMQQLQDQLNQQRDDADWARFQQQLAEQRWALKARTGATQQTMEQSPVCTCILIRIGGKNYCDWEPNSGCYLPSNYHDIVKQVQRGQP